MQIATLITDLPHDRSERAQKVAALYAEDWRLVALDRTNPTELDGYFEKELNKGALSGTG